MIANRAFVTGGTGFLGANLVAGLNVAGIQARVLRRQSSSLLALEGLTYESVEGDVLDSPEKLAGLMDGCEWVFHVAAVSDYWRQKPDWIHKVNVDGTRNVLTAAQMAGVQRLIYTGSGSALGLPAEGELLNEQCDFNLKPEQWPYAYSKYLAEDEVRRACDDGLACVVVLPTLVIGPRDLNLVAGSIIVEAARGLARVYPPGGTNYVAVSDVVAGHITAAKMGRVGERYVLAGENITHKEAVEVVCEIVGRPPPKLGLPPWSLPPIAAAVNALRLVFGNRIPFEARQVRLSGCKIYFDASKSVQELGLTRTSFRVAAKRAYDWYNDNGFLERPYAGTD